MQGCEKTESPVLYRFKFVKDEASLKWSILSSKLLSGFSWISWRRWLHKDYSSHLTGTMKEFYGCFLAPLDRKHHPVCWAESCLSSSSEGAEANDAEGHPCQGSRVLCLLGKAFVRDLGFQVYNSLKRLRLYKFSFLKGCCSHCLASEVSFLLQSMSLSNATPAKLDHKQCPHSNIWFHHFSWFLWEVETWISSQRERNWTSSVH